MDRFARVALGPLVLRWGLAIVFIYHGMEEILPKQSGGVGWDRDLHVAVRAQTALGELHGGLAGGLGFLRGLAALVLIAIAAHSIATVTGQYGFPLAKGGYEYQFSLIVMGATLVLTGSGPIGLDYWLFPNEPPAS